MLETCILGKDHLPSLLRRLKKNHRLVAPVRNRQGDTLFTLIQELDQVDIDLENQAIASAKPYLFPQQETLFTYEISAAGDYRFTPLNSAADTIYFGLRSCDLAAILYMDVTFLGQAKDPYYLKRRENAILISIGCTQPFANCFCNATKSGPFLEMGYDLQFTDLGDRYFVEVGRIRGRELITRLGHFFTPAREEDKKAQYQLSLEARGNFHRQVQVERAIRRLREDRVPDAIWEALSRRCQDCSGCTYICPTCTCFTIRDQAVTADSGLRIRNWDACTFAGFTRMAGGHNPVDHQTQAIRRRFRHKLLHDVTRHGRPSCVGCGRCIDICFGGVDMARFVAMVCEE
ncbi:MAG: 4Fe-4S dicluster domain-containing protein [Desulfobacterales bacterium]|nr:4Fe-4S dicluster domain-containing protein [Desulfobacterales bacterium]